ncbi:hypothetical protein CARUB_v10022233mg, partial [Capsella rubella]
MAPLRVKKPNKSYGLDDDLKTKRIFFKRIFPAFKKKATELSVLCGNSVGFICYGPDNDLHVWPEPKDNPQALPEIVGKFNALSDHRRMSHASDLFDFPNLKGLSGEELRSHLDELNSRLAGIKQQKIGLLRRGNFKPKIKETGKDDHIRVSDKGNRLGFDELGYVFRGSHETVSNLGSCAASKVSSDVAVSDPSLTLGFSGGDYLPVDSVPTTDNYGVCANEGASDLRRMEFASTLFPGYDRS